MIAFLIGAAVGLVVGTAGGAWLFLSIPRAAAYIFSHQPKGK